VPTCSFRALGFDFVSPVRNRGKIIIAEQLPNLQLGSGTQMRARDVSDDAVAFRSPGK
jgi:hypothetical protein